MGSYVLPSVVPKMDVRGAAHKFTSVIWIPNSWKNNHCPVWCLAKWLLRDPHFFKVIIYNYLSCQKCKKKLTLEHNYSFWCIIISVIKYLFHTPDNGLTQTYLKIYSNFPNKLHINYYKMHWLKTMIFYFGFY